MRLSSIIFDILLVYFKISDVYAWQKWNHELIDITTDDWKDIWGHSKGPRKRHGHSIVLWESENKIYLIMFGGRDEDMQKEHIPKSFELVEEEGILDFKSYDGKPIYNELNPLCQPAKSCIPLTNASSGNKESCIYEWGKNLSYDIDFNNHNLSKDEIENTLEDTCNYVSVGAYYNDLWQYDLDCKRYSDNQCEDVGWQVLHPGSIFGDCYSKPNGERKCKIPSERWGHDAEMIDSDTMLVYGGFSQECDDYCDDLWSFNFKTLSWEEVSIKKLELLNDVNSENNEENKKYLKKPDTPGKRWKFSMVSGIWDGSVNSQKKVVLFGGHRLWHGFRDKVVEQNDWLGHDGYPNGGYLNDLWVFIPSPSSNKSSQRSNHNISNSTDNKNSSSLLSGSWTEITRRKNCDKAPGLSWETRNNEFCKIHWPKPRAGHVAIGEPERQAMYVHGGYATYYPYIKSNGARNPHDKKIKGNEFVPFSTFSFYLEDLWIFNFSTGFWEEIIPVSNSNPSRRTDHVMMLSNSRILVLFGGYAFNQHFNDTWFFYLDKKAWVKKTEFVHAYYPEQCTDDIKFIKSNDNNCVKLEYPLPLKRYNGDSKEYPSSMNLQYQDILPFRFQNGYTPSYDNPYYTGIVDNATLFIKNLQKKYLENEVYDSSGHHRIFLPEKLVADGEPIAPYAATGPNQYAQVKRMVYNETFDIHVWEWCTSVKGEPTRDRIGNWRNQNKVLIPQRRRKSPGWDGCRDLEWKIPTARSNHDGIFVNKYDMIVIYGGLGYEESTLDKIESVSSFSREDYPTEVMDDMWVFNINNCIHNCSDNGVCTNGFCKCYPGYYGIDCSNYTCPGSVCFYDDDVTDGMPPTQHCTHCCHDGYYRNDLTVVDEYIADVRKYPCRRRTRSERVNSNFLSLFTGSSQGICDGFGSCQCIPGYLGEDCSMQDCLHNCSFHGYCSVEYPVSRCICHEGYFGTYCQHKHCLNNCSYPNGQCDFETGQCSCREIYDPYTLNRIWAIWEGEDCSFLTPWCAASSLFEDVASNILFLFTYFFAFYVGVGL